jgi:hypothetical protein
MFQFCSCGLDGLGASSRQEAVDVRRPWINRRGEGTTRPEAMGANARKVEHYILDDWREVVCQIEHMIKWGWTVEERCPTCKVRLVADLPRIPRRQ